MATILSEREISIEAAIQREQARLPEQARVPGESASLANSSWVPIVILTHTVRESVMDNALAAVQGLPDVVGDIMRIRVEHFSPEPD